MLLFVDKHRFPFKFSGSLASGILTLLFCRHTRILCLWCRRVWCCWQWLHVTTWLVVRCSELLLHIQFLESVSGPSDRTSFSPFVLFFIILLLFLVSCLSFVLSRHTHVSRPCCGDFMPLHTRCHFLFSLDSVVTKSDFDWVVIKLKCDEYGYFVSSSSSVQGFPCSNIL